MELITFYSVSKSADFTNYWGLLGRLVMDMTQFCKNKYLNIALPLIQVWSFNVVYNAFLSLFSQIN